MKSEEAISGVRWLTECFRSYVAVDCCNFVIEMSFCLNLFKVLFLFGMVFFYRYFSVPNIDVLSR